MNPRSVSNAGSKNGKDITILLLGETGVGKSTWVNGFVNFLKYESLEEAENNPTLCIIPTSFTMTDDNYEERLITTGNDKNEVMETGQSATQHPLSYTFPQEDYVIRLIDTPGIGDVRGVEQDKKNFEMVLDHISHLEDIHAICILLKPNNARLNIMFTFCIKELLTHLHRDACRNIVFCFTNSRSTFYRPGDTLPALRKLLEEREDVKITLNHSTIYCMDNESIRFLYALKGGINFTGDERKNYFASWDKSVAEVRRLLDHAAALQPHAIRDTLSLNNARQTILALGNPMAEITRNIQITIASREESKEKIMNSKLSREELSKNLVIQETRVKCIPLDEPRTICTADSCVEIVKVGTGSEKNYRTHCHEGCGQGKQKHWRIINIVGHKALKKCSAFDKNGDCRHCGCSWKFHMKISYETSRETNEIIDFGKRIQIDETTSAIEKIEKFVEYIDRYLLEMELEQEEITKASVKFAQFLRSNAITPYNDSMDAYLVQFINEERRKVEEGRSNPKVLEGLEEMREKYKRQMEFLETAMADGGTEGKLSTDELHNCIQCLYHLKHSGKILMDMMNVSRYTATTNYTEKLIETTQNSTTIGAQTTKPIIKKKPGFLSSILGKYAGKKIPQNSRSNPDSKKNATQNPNTLPEGIRKELDSHAPRNPARQIPEASTGLRYTESSNRIGMDSSPVTLSQTMPNLELPAKGKSVSPLQKPPPLPVSIQLASPRSSPPRTDARSSLLAEIREGTVLKKQPKQTNPGMASSNRNGNDEALLRALGERAKRFQSSPEDDSDKDNIYQDFD